jgi:hypothetical protein
MAVKTVEVKQAATIRIRDAKMAGDFIRRNSGERGRACL